MKTSADGMIVLTGASSGIGLAMTKVLLKKGYFVIFYYDFAFVCFLVAQNKRSRAG